MSKATNLDVPSYKLKSFSYSARINKKKDMLSTIQYVKKKKKKKFTGITSSI